MALKLFDFLVVPVHRSGGTALQRFLSVHPNVNAVPKWTLDRYLANDREQELLEEAQCVMRDDFRLGLVQHEFIMEHAPLDAIAERLSKIVRKDGLIMVFRDHFDTMISAINHANIVRYCGYKFGAAGLFWPESTDLAEGLGPHLDSLKTAPVEPHDPSGRTSEKAAFLQGKHLDHFHSGHIQETYERYFSGAHVFGYDSLFSANNSEGVAQLFRCLGVEEPADDPFFRCRQAGRQTRFLEHACMLVRPPQGPQVDVNLTPNTIFERSIDSHGKVIANIDDDYTRAHFGDTLSLVNHAEADTVAKGDESDSLFQATIDEFLREFFFPLWKKNYDSVSRAIDSFRVRQLLPEDKAMMREPLSDDAAAFFARNPDLYASWGADWEGASSRSPVSSPGRRRAASP